ncbi:MAG: M48 family metallopeptidase [Opitutaceae bacterium]|nr:M48 family metallopeptidase [Opitutaceae bacterium]MBP9900253.1 M48 family metallopeptidase [Verrucomicrobiota bacterium]
MSDRLSIATAAGRALLLRSDRTTLAVSVRPDGTVELRAPKAATVPSIQAKVKTRLRWIVRQRIRFRDMQRDRVPLRYESGSTHTYLGRQYRLKVTEASKASVRLKGAYIHIASPSKRSAQVKTLLDGWLRDRAIVQFSTRLEKWKPWCEARKLPTPSVRLLRMPKRWGSAHRTGRILLNPELVKAPAICVDYVIVHEVCHLKHPQHDRAFFRLLSEVFPTWQAVKIRLERSAYF